MSASKWQKSPTLLEEPCTFKKQNLRRNTQIPISLLTIYHKDRPAVSNGKNYTFNYLKNLQYKLMLRVSEF
jgi:hypothetical protein